MADSDKTLKLLIELGVIGQQDAQAAQQLLDEFTKSQEELNQSMPENLQNLASGWAGWDKYKTSLYNASGESEKFNFHGREMKRLMNELDGAVPGLGKAIEGLQKTITGAGGGFVVVQLAIEATKLYWDMYQESVARAERATAEKFDRMRTVAADALKSFEDFRARLEKAKTTEDPVADKLAQDRAKMEAQFAGRRQLMEKDKQTEMEAATTPEAKAAIEKKYADKFAALESGREASNLALIENAIKKLSEDKEKATNERSRLQELLDEVVSERGAFMRRGLDTAEQDAKITDLQKKMQAQADIIVGAETKLTKYGGEKSTAETIHNINDSTRDALENRTISRAVMESFPVMQHGDKLSSEQRSANTALTQLFSQYAGGIQAMQQVIQYHLQHSTTQAQQIQALKNALSTLEQQVSNGRNSVGG